MGRPVAIRNLVIEVNLTNLSILRDALSNYHQYLKDVLIFEHPTILTKSAIKRRIRYLEEFADALEFSNEG